MEFSLNEKHSMVVTLHLEKVAVRLPICCSSIANTRCASCTLLINDYCKARRCHQTMKNTFNSLRRNHSALDLQVPEAPPAAPQATGATSVPDNDSSAARLWNNLKHHQPAQPLEYYSADDVPWNDSGVQCVRNANCLRVQTGTDPQSRVPMHAHVLPPSENAPAESIRYAATQAPAGSQDAWTRTMIHALHSGQGIFQFVSPKAHRHAVSPRAPTNVRRKHPSILDELLLRTSVGDGNVNVRLGDRFALTKVTPIVTEGGNDDHVQYLIEAEDLPGAPSPQRKYSTVLTQAGLPFAHAVLTPDAIVRASALLDAHQRKTSDVPSDQRAPVRDASQLIVSHAGIGRNATLIVYRDIVSKIDANMVNRANLDETLYASLRPPSLPMTSTPADQIAMPTFRPVTC